MMHEEAPAAALDIPPLKHPWIPHGVDHRRDFARAGLIHIAAIVGPFFTGADPAAIALCVGLYWVRMFGVTAGYHRYFSHRTYKMGRAMQLGMALLAMSSMQKGVVWWARNHRHHHRFSDKPNDIHSVKQQGFWHAHLGWLFTDAPDQTSNVVRDLERFPELVWLDRWWGVPPVALAALCTLALGWQGLVVGFLLSTVLLWHGTFTINSLTHVFGRRRYATDDDSKNSFLLAIVTMGEGWHNNHHRYMRCTRQGFEWWQWDPTYYALWCMERLRLVRDIRPPPPEVLTEARPT